MCVRMSARVCVRASVCVLVPHTQLLLHVLQRDLVLLQVADLLMEDQPDLFQVLGSVVPERQQQQRNAQCSC